ncbi:helix-turn-helix domain-containing protein [Bacillus sp. JJ722]|uniref:helix-turn-helix domain-containing protein n=1 Tax=Bacillus sp. JJ722 TaxID=3122973 RepID=UPI002FFE57B5
MSIGKNIKKLREKHHLSQKDLAEIAGVSDKAVSTWENGIKEPRMGAIQKIADHFGILKSNIIEESNVIEQLKKTNIKASDLESKCKSVPLYGRIAAGIPIEMIEVKEWINIPIEIADRYPDAFMVKIAGDSMNKVIPNNALALIDPSQEVINSDIAVVAVNGYEATLKRFFKFQDGIALEPESYNPIHKTQFFTPEELEYTPICIKGKLVWYMAPIDVKF